MFCDAVGIVYAFRCIHGLYARNAPFAHGHTVSDVEVGEAAVLFQDKLDGQKAHAHCNNYER